MSEKSGMWQLDTNDWIRSVTSAVFVAVVAVVYGVTTQSGFDLFTADWGGIFKMTINAAFITFMGRLAEKFTTAPNGKVFGRIG